MIANLLNGKLVDPKRIKEIESNINVTINDLSEIYPVFAYELSGQYMIKERLDGAKNYFNEFEELVEAVPKELSNWIQPRLSEELLKELDFYILGLAKKINRKTYKYVSALLSLKPELETEDFDNFINDYIEQIKNFYSNNLE